MTCHFVVGLDQDRAGEAEQCLGVGEVPRKREVPQPTTSVRRLISLFSRSSGLVDQLFQCATGKAVKASRVVLRLAEHGLHGGELAAEHAGDDVELGVHVLGVGLGED